MNLSQSAVSHQIKALEEFFGLPMFNRVGRTVELTVAGMDFLDTVAEVLEELSRGKRRMNFYFKPGAVVIGTSPGFANRWLLPRYHSLKQRVQHIEPWLFTSNETYELSAQEVDLAIWYGDVKWPGVRSQKLFHDYLSPLYAEHLFDDDMAINSYADLANHTLLHDERTEDWLYWFQKVNFNFPEVTSGASFSDASLSLESACRGIGVTLGSLILAREPLESGALVQPFNQVVKTQHAYYLVAPEGQRLRPAVEQTRQWLLDEVSSMSAESNYEIV
mgnify:CR=1 FL=1